MKFNLKKVVLTCISVSVLIIVLILIAYIMKERHMDAPQITQQDQQKPPSLNQSSNIKIGIIGDSWVSGKKLDQSISDELKSSGINAEIISFGHPGAKSKQIYEDLISDSTAPYSSNSLLLDNDIQYIVVIAGVNDSACHIGKDFYTCYMTNIVSEINSHAKFPVIVELPEFGIKDQKEGFLSASKHFIFKELFDNGKTDVIADYRNALKAELNKCQLNYTIIPFEPVISDYSSNIDLYANPSHLSKEGCYKLGSYIGQSIADYIK